MRTTDFCFSLPDYEYPCFVSYRLLFEAHASPLADGLAPAMLLAQPTNETGGPGVSRRRIRFGTLRVGWRAESCSDAPFRAVPLTPLSLPDLRLRRFRVGPCFRLPRRLPSPLREEETSSTARGAFHRQVLEGCPSSASGIAAGGASRACVNRCQSRSRSRDVVSR
jgi:hypothetical protein